MKTAKNGNCNKCKRPRVRRPWQADPGDLSKWGWMTYCEHCHHISSFNYDIKKPLPSQDEIEETIRKYRMWI